ncbi:Hint domain-containing protein [Anianabacter salinae]|uniref:Hint domain-containing protein n=1 Tax=Anianabacter salinae TaxID=2851023 RepID=UPI00225E486D|nr:Hint domain-containing protein [Anianabacter salinae]MBV0913388.1 Hint domain-containing protein [Anianabacter salinae]
MPQDWTIGAGGLAAGTMIGTPQGARPVEDLAPGDAVKVDGLRAYPVLWCGCLPGVPVFRLVQAGRTPLWLAASHHIVLEDAVVQLQFGMDAVLAEAGLVGGTPAPARAVHVLCLERHATVEANGWPVETLFLTAEIAERITHAGGPRIEPHRQACLPTLYPDEIALWRQVSGPVQRPKAA